MLKFAANLEFLFTRESAGLVDRIKLAADAGFKGIELACPYDISPSVLSSAKESSCVEQVLLNSWPGDVSAGDWGICIFPDRRDEFRKQLELSVTYLKVVIFFFLQCMHQNTLRGLAVPGPAGGDYALPGLLAAMGGFF